MLRDGKFIAWRCARVIVLRFQIMFGFFPDIEATTWCDAVGIRSSASPLVFSAAPYLPKYHFVIQSMAVGVK